MKKHAYLIMAHNEPKLFQTLLSCLDDERNDLFVHIDVKADIEQFRFYPIFSKIYYVDGVDVRWGDFSQVQAEYVLMEAAAERYNYDYYHLLSGVDLPIKSQDYIHSFFENLQYKGEFVGFVSDNDTQWKDRINYHYIFLKYHRSASTIVRVTTKLLQVAFVNLQKAIGYKRKWSVEIKKGANWFSITDEFCRYAISQRENVLKLFNKVPCCDEVFLQTLLYNWKPEKVFSRESEYDGNLREIDWKRGMPYTWREAESDFFILKNSKCLFARKFSLKYPQIIEIVVKELANNE